MSEFDINLVKQLREMTNAAILDCKNAIKETNGNIEEARDLLRKKGILKAEKKSSRITAEGLVGIKATEKEAVIVELNCETDFVAKNEKFQKLCNDVMEISFANQGDREKTLKSEINSAKLEEIIKQETSVIGENISFRRSDFIKIESGIVVHYIHNTISSNSPNLGKIGVIIALESDGDRDKLKKIGKELAMHIAASRPQSIEIADLDPKMVAKEREIISEETSNTTKDKPANVREKIVEGRLNKFFSEIVLLEQVFVVDGETKIKDLLKTKSKEIGSNDIKVKDFIYYQVGEGVTKIETNFADEVANMTKDR